MPKVKAERRKGHSTRNANRHVPKAGLSVCAHNFNSEFWGQMNRRYKFSIKKGDYKGPILNGSPQFKVNVELQEGKI